MNTNNKIYSFFIIIALLFWNPLSYFLFYSNTPIYELKILQVMVWLIFLCGIILIFIIQKNIVNDLIKNIIFVVTLIGILYAGFVTMDRLYGLFKKDDIGDKDAKWLIFEPYSQAKYKTFEFEFTADINSLGLRDHEIIIDKDSNFRILCFGDSWTYGYGVNLEDSWPKVLEKNLIKSGLQDVEVINCARPGQFTGTYKEYMSIVVPLLKPDLVLVGVLQLDDLAQVYTNYFLINNTGTVSTILRKGSSVVLRFFKYSFKNIISPTRQIIVTENWSRTTRKMIKNFNQWQKLRFSTLDESVQNYFLSGDIEPSLLNYYINYPDRNIIFNNPDNNKTKFAIEGMNNDIKEMKEICQNNNATMVFINIPINYFTGHQVLRNPSDQINLYLEKNNNIDKIYHNIAQANKVPYLELTDHFIKLPNKTEYLYKYDGHPNAKGYAEIANYISEKLINYDLVPVSN